MVVVITQENYEQYSNKSLYGNYIYDKKYVKFHYVYELELYITDEIDRDAICNSDPDLKGSRIVELCKYDIDEHSVRTLHFILPKMKTVNDIILLQSNTYNRSWEVSLNLLLENNGDITQNCIEFATILINHTPDLIYRYDISNNCALYTIVRKCILNENMNTLLIIMLEALYNYVKSKCDLCIADFNCNIKTADYSCKGVNIILILANTVRIVIDRYPSIVEDNMLVNNIVKNLLKTNRLIIKYVKKQYDTIKVGFYDYNTIVNLKSIYYDCKTTPLHKMLYTALTGSETYRNQTLTVYNSVLEHGFLNDKIRDKFITTVVDDNDITCSMYAKMLNDSITV